jgi:hypothetical protein
MYPIVVPDVIRTRSRARAIAFQHLLALPQPKHYAPGQIWSTRSDLALSAEQTFPTDDPRVIVVLETFEPVAETLPHVMAAPISLDVQMATDFDVILDADKNPFNLHCMIEVWNEVPVLEVHLNRFLGTLSGDVTEIIFDLGAVRALGETPNATLAQWTGSVLFGSEDPRYAFQLAEVDAVSYLARAATAAIELPVAVTESAPVLEMPVRRPLVFTLQPVWDLLSKYTRGPAVAFAAGEAEHERTLVHQRGAEASFIIEITHQKRPPYHISAIIHDLSANLADHQVVITVRTPALVFESAPAELKKETPIIIGEQARFKPADIESVTITIE